MSSCCVFSFKRLSVRVVISASSCDPGARSLFLTEVTNRLHLFRLNTFITMRIIFFICDVVLLTFSFYHLWDAVLWSVWFYWESWGLFPFVSACNCLAEEWTTLFCFQHIQRVHRAWRVTVQPVLLRSAHALPQLRGTNSSTLSSSDFTAAHLWGNSSSFFLVVKAERGSRLWAKLLFFLSRRIESPPAFTVRAVGPNPPLLITNYPLTVTVVFFKLQAIDKRQRT